MTDETDDLVDAHREAVREAREQMVANGAIDDSIAEALAEFARVEESVELTAVEEARIRAMEHNQDVRWDHWIDDSDWRTHGCA